MVGGVEYEVDCIIYASGFEVGTEYKRRAGFDVAGRDGLKLSDAWAEGMRSLHGLLVQGFPNLMITSNAQSGFTTNFPHAMDERARHMAYLLHSLRPPRPVTS